MESTTTDLDWKDPNIPYYVLPQNVGTLDVVLKGLSPDTRKVQGTVKWFVRRNPDDYLNTEKPQISAKNSRHIGVTTNAEGSFNIIAFLDLNKSGDWQSNWESNDESVIGVLNIVLIKCTVEGNTDIIYSDSKHFEVFPAEEADIVVFESGKDGFKPILLGGGKLGSPPSVRVRLEGGGADGQIGLDNIVLGNNKLRLGWIGNISRLNLVATYAQEQTKTRRIIPNTPVPLLDTYRDGAGTGGDTAFRFFSTDELFAQQPVRGQTRLVFAGDKPAVPFPYFFPKTHDTVTAMSGTIVFKEFLAVFSEYFPRSYSALGFVEWTLSYKCIKKLAADAWDSTGCSVKADSILTVSGFPKTAADAGMQTKSPVAASKMEVVPP